MQALISVQEAEYRILRSIEPLPPETVSLAEAHLRTLRQLILSDRPAPPFDRAMMDGICLSSKTRKNSLPIAATQPAGAPPLTLTDPDTCIEIMTGAPLPKNADCIVPIERIEIENNIATLLPEARISEGQHIHPTGSDVPAQSPLIEPGTVLTPPELAIAASNGHHRITVTSLPEIHLITTGDEVIPVSSDPEPYQIRSSHPAALLPLIQHSRLGNITHTHLPDDPIASENLLRESLTQADFIILTGGISKGKFDHIAPTLRKLIGQPHFHGVAQRPGKPLAYWKSPEVPPVLALPGNPVSVMATTARYLLPALRRLAGQTAPPETAPLAHSFRNNSPLPTLLPYTIGNGQIHLHPPRNSGDYLTLKNTKGFAHLPTPNHHYPAGTSLRIHSL